MTLRSATIVRAGRRYSETLGRIIGADPGTGASRLGPLDLASIFASFSFFRFLALSFFSGLFFVSDLLFIFDLGFGRAFENFSAAAGASSVVAERLGRVLYDFFRPGPSALAFRSLRLKRRSWPPLRPVSRCWQNGKVLRGQKPGLIRPQPVLHERRFHATRPSVGWPTPVSLRALTAC